MAAKPPLSADPEPVTPAGPTRKRAARTPPSASTRKPRASAKRTPQEVPSHGPTETAVRAEVAALNAAGEHPSEALAQMAYHLARKLDTDAGLATAAVARELRATLAALTPVKETDDGDDLDALIATLSSPVEHAKD